MCLQDVNGATSSGYSRDVDGGCSSIGYDVYAVSVIECRVRAASKIDEPCLVISKGKYSLAKILARSLIF